MSSARPVDASESVSLPHGLRALLISRADAGPPPPRPPEHPDEARRRRRAAAARRFKDSMRDYYREAQR